MKTYIKLLQTLDVKDSLFVHQKRIAFLLSGQSDLKHSELSLEQKNLLRLQTSEHDPGILQKYDSVCLFHL